MFTSKKIDGFSIFCSIFYSIFYHFLSSATPNLSIDGKKNWKKLRGRLPHATASCSSGAQHHMITSMANPKKSVVGFFHQGPVFLVYLVYLWLTFSHKRLPFSHILGIIELLVRAPRPDLAPALHWKVPRLLASWPGWITKGSGDFFQGTKLDAILQKMLEIAQELVVSQDGWKSQNVTPW